MSIIQNKTKIYIMYILLLQNNIHSNTLQTLPVMLHSSEVRHA